VRAYEQLHRRVAEEGVEETARDVPEALPHAELVTAFLELLAERRDREAPERVAREAHRNEDEQEGSPPLARECAERARAVGGFPARSERELDGEEADHEVEETGGSHAEPPQPAEPGRLVRRAGGRDRRCLSEARSPHPGRATR
jgi:hypothetical protein